MYAESFANSLSWLCHWKGLVGNERCEGGLPLALACAGCPTILYHFDGGIGMVDNVEQEVPTAQAITLETNLPFPYMMYLAMWYVITSVGVCTLRKKKG